MIEGLKIHRYSEVSMAKSDTIQAIQASEKRVKLDTKEANLILDISKYLSATQVKDVRLSALNSLRRISASSSSLGVCALRKTASRN